MAASPGHQEVSPNVKTLSQSASPASPVASAGGSMGEVTPKKVSKDLQQFSVNITILF